MPNSGLEDASPKAKTNVQTESEMGQGAVIGLVSGGVLFVVTATVVVIIVVQRYRCPKKTGQQHQVKLVSEGFVVNA